MATTLMVSLLTSESLANRITTTAVAKLVRGALGEAQVGQTGHLVLDVVVLVEKVLQGLENGILEIKNSVKSFIFASIGITLGQRKRVLPTCASTLVIKANKAKTFATVVMCILMILTQRSNNKSALTVRERARVGVNIAVTDPGSDC